MKAWLGMRMKQFENAELPDNVIGVLPLYKTIADAKKDGVERRDLKRMTVIAQSKLFER